MIATHSERQEATKPSHYKVTRCLLCGSGDLALALPLARSAVGNDYLREARRQERFALSLHL